MRIRIDHQPARRAKRHFALHDAAHGSQATHYVDKALIETVRFMRRNGLVKFEKGDLKLELTPAAVNLEWKKSSTGNTEDEPKPVPLSEEDVLFWSSPGVPPEVEAADGQDH